MERRDSEVTGPLQLLKSALGRRLEATASASSVTRLSHRPTVGCTVGDEKQKSTWVKTDVITGSAASIFYP